MKIVFLSNFFNHHQKPLSDALYYLLRDGYYFIATIPMEEERKKLGYLEITAPYVKQYQDNQEICIQLIGDADVVIYGSAPRNLIEARLKQGKMVLLYSERIYKKKPAFYEMPIRMLKYYNMWGRYTNAYLLCASAYTATDYAKTHTFINKGFKWGYFPETKHYQLKQLFTHKNPKKILWVGRFLDWKHPDDAIRVAKCLKDTAYDFQMDIVGTGAMEEQLKEMTRSMSLADCVTFLGPIPSNEVRGVMENAGIFLFTSDRNEGWGAVLNEAMNSGCAVVASDAIGAVPFLINSSENGMVYQSGDINALFEHVKYLLDYSWEQERLGHAAYETIIHEWNAEVAAQRLVKLAEQLQMKKASQDLFVSGPCSKAMKIKDDC